MPDPQKDGLDDYKRRESDSVKVAIIGTGDGGVEHGMVARTPAGQPNLVVVIVNPIIALLVRFAHAYVAALVALMAGIPVLAKAGEHPIVPFSDFWDLLVKSLTLAAAGPSLELLRDIVTILSRLKDKYPLASGNV